jgi:hypothetical protein
VYGWAWCAPFGWGQYQQTTCVVVMAISMWMIPKMAPAKVVVYVGRIRSGRIACEPSTPAIRKSVSPGRNDAGGYTHRAVRRKRENGLLRVRVIVITIDQVTLTRKAGMALSRLSNVGGSKRPEWE